MEEQRTTDAENVVTEASGGEAAVAETTVAENTEPENAVEAEETAKVAQNSAIVAQNAAEVAEIAPEPPEPVISDVPDEPAALSDEPAATPDEPAALPDEFAAAPDEVSELRRELDELRSRFEQQRQTMERMSRECDEFAELYPDRPLSSLPREVWDNVRAGIPLAAAYAYAEARREHAERLARKVNDRNDGASSGDVSGRTADYFSPAEVRGMTPAEVRANYSKIMDSMRLWS